MKRTKLYRLVNWIWILVLIALIFPTSGVLASSPGGGPGWPALPPEPRAPLPSFGTFSAGVANGNPDQVVGVYVKDLLALPVVQQPADNPAYVSEQPDVATQFSLGKKHNTVGLMAHNYLAGGAFFDLEEGREITLVYGDGTSTRYRVREVQRYRAINPDSISTEFIGLQEIAPILTAKDLFDRTYGLEEDLLVFQTCIAKDGEDSWGRLFVIAEPL